MSLTSQLKNPDSAVCQFFSLYENKDGIDECLAMLRSSSPFLTEDLPHPFFVPAIVGTASDYLIRYIANGNKINFHKTIAAEAVLIGRITHSPYMQVLYDLGQCGLNGQAATTPHAVVSSLALTLLDNFYRSGRLPQSFSAKLSTEDRKNIRKILYGEDYLEKKVFFQFFKFLEQIGGDILIRDISTIANLFENGLENSQSEIYGIRFSVYNRTLRYSHLVGGADFDCVIRHKDAHVLSEIKSIKRNINADHLRQLLGYNLLYSRSHDRFTLTHLGVYYSRACSFRYLPIEFLTAKCLPTFNSTNAARSAFKKHLNEFEPPR